ncbi:MAG TPA: DNA-3-methyladenine glycosylase 2 family protein [Actinomycetota bacterium]|nr:DNA-3-methyladenine glycosylase 2 family protein [Actinomycetota bacterium]
MTAAVIRAFPITRPVDLPRTLFPLRRGTGDPTMRVGDREAWRATRTQSGPATFRLALEADRLIVEAWGPGADEALERAPGWAGLRDVDHDFRAHHRLIADLHRRLAGVRLTVTGRPVEALIPAVLEQKVTGHEARAAYRRLTLAVGEPAPGPGELVLPPDPAAVAALPSFRFHPFGVERRRAERLIGLCRRAAQIDALADEAPGVVRERLQAFPGIGPWTAAEVARLALGDTDAISIGDYHLPNIVAWALAGEPRADDARMLELLEPYTGQRGRVQLLLEAGGIRAPAFGPRADVRAIERI